MESLLVKAVTFICVVLILSVFSHCQHTNYLIAKGIEGGADPIAARMALSQDGSYNSRTVYLMKGEGNGR